MVNWGTLKIWYLQWRLCRLEARVQKLKEEWVALKGGGDVAY